MRVKILASAFRNSPPTVGPYKTLHIVEVDAAYQIGDATHYGPVVMIAPDIAAFNEDAEQSVIVNLNPATLNFHPDQSIYPKPPSSYNHIHIYPIVVDSIGSVSDEPPPEGVHSILPDKNLTIENVSPLITKDTFSTWKHECFLSKDTANSLDSIKYAVVHRYTSPMHRDGVLDRKSVGLVNDAIACLALLRPTRQPRGRRIRGVIEPDGRFTPHTFDLDYPPEVPEIQKLFSIRKKDIDLLCSVLPKFIHLYQRDENGKMKDDYEPLRMAIQLYEQAYDIRYWKARHILLWSAIEPLFGNGGKDGTTPIARIYALFGNHILLDGYKRSIYDKGDIPTCFSQATLSHCTLGETVPFIYSVRNFSAHGQKVPDSYFTQVEHPLGQTVKIDILAEAATFIIRKTVVAILEQGWQDKFKNSTEREDFWLYEYGLNKNQCKKRLKDAGIS